MTRIIIIVMGFGAFLWLIEHTKKVDVPSQSPAPTTISTPAEPERYVTMPDVTVTAWEKGGFGSVAIMSFKIRNDSPLSWVKDIGVVCAFSGKSGSVINTRSTTIYETVKPKQSLSVNKLSVGFIDQQVTGAACRVVKAEACCGLLVR